MPKQVGIGITGLDNWYHAFPFADFCTENTKARLIAVSDPVEEKAKQFAEKYGVKHWYTDYGEVLKHKDVRIAVVTSCTSSHAKIAVDAAKAGKHILLDKPMAAKLGDADRIINAANEAKVKLMMTHAYRFAPCYVRTKELIDIGVIGKPKLAVYTTRAPLPEDWPGSGRPGWYADPERAVGGAFIDHAAHNVDIILWLFGGRVRKVYAEMDKLIHKDLGAEDYGIATLKFEDESIVTVESSWTALPPTDFDEILQIGGDKGLITASQTMSPALRVCGKMEPFKECLRLEVPLTHWTENQKRVLEHLIDCVIQDRRPLVPGEDGRATLEVCLAAYESARTGRPVQLA